MGLSPAHAGELLEISVTKVAGLGSSPRYLALLTELAASDGSYFPEATYPGYERAAVAGSAWESADDAGVVRNAAAIGLPPVTAGPDVHVAQAALLKDPVLGGASPGNLLHLITVPAFVIAVGDTPKLAAGLVELIVQGSA